MSTFCTRFLVKEHLGAWTLPQTFSKKKVVVVADNAVASTLARPLADRLNLPLLLFEGGEALKSREGKAKIEEALFALGCGRDSALLLVGGGTLLDVGGFVAATYCRKIPYISFPTTLLAMTDAAIGGKTGINAMGVKNFLGAFHHPDQIIVVLESLKTLPHPLLVGGLSESIKHALIAEPSFFAFLENHLEKVLQGDITTLKELIVRSASIKNTIVEQDVEEGGVRALLNLGHTLAHALEAGAGYALSHGEAVAIGLVIEGWIAKEKNYLSHKDFNRMVALIKRLPFSFAMKKKLAFETLIPLLKRDKKNRGGAVHMVLLKGIGSVETSLGYTGKVEESLLKESILWANSALLSTALH